MDIIGIDFTSAPRRAKPIVCAIGTRAADTFTLHDLRGVRSLADFATVLAARPPALIGLDLPFGLPRPFLAWAGWGDTWTAIAETVATMPKAEFLATIKAYRDQQPAGQKHPLRHCDRLARAISPLMVHGVPVGRMWYVAAPMLLRSGLSIQPNRPTADSRTAVEVYPALVARAVGIGPYKSDTAARQSADHATQRDALLKALQCGLPAYGDLRLVTPHWLAERCLHDARGDTLDAVCAAYQAAWAAHQPDYAIPADADPLEGWIADPSVRINP